MNREAYITQVSTPSYVEGALVLNYSLRKAGTRYPLVATVTPNISRAARRLLERCGIDVRVIEPLANPVRADGKRSIQQCWDSTYSKLRIFGLCEFRKLVYLDADMLVCKGLDELFRRPHLSAVNAGGMLPDRADWLDLNSGLLVIEPGRVDFADMMSKVGRLPVKDNGDQTFLHAYFPGWPRDARLHLDHSYNMFYSDLDRYNQLFGYVPIASTQPIEWERHDPRTVHIIHYIGAHKPWHPTFPAVLDQDERRREHPLMHHAVRLWLGFRDELSRSLTAAERRLLGRLSGATEGRARSPRGRHRGSRSAPNRVSGANSAPSSDS